MQLRNQKRAVPVELVTEPAMATEEQDPLQDERMLKDLEEAMQHLKKEQKTCIRMFYLQRKSYQSIAEETGFNLLQVKSYIQNGKRNLRLLLEKKFHQSEPDNE